MMTVLITLTYVGANTGPTYDLFSDVDGYTSAFETGVQRANLMIGYVSYLVPDSTTIIRVCATEGICRNCIDIVLNATTTTTTTVVPTTTTTTTNNGTTTTTTTSYGGPWYYYDVQTYTCNGVNCISNGYASRIANQNNSITVGHFYFDMDSGFIFKIVDFAIDQLSPGYYTNFIGAGLSTCNAWCLT